MAKCVIFCAGACSELLEKPNSCDYIVTADAGLRHARTFGLCPNEVLGDFDSLGYIPENATVHPVEKDDTDAMLAARRGLELGFREFWFYGSLDGPRLDHTVANFQMLRFLAEHGAVGYLIGENQIVTVVKDGSLCFPSGAEGTVSVFCMGADATGVTLQGLRYPLEAATLTGSFPLGVSNHFLKEAATVTVGDGCLLVIWDRKNGIPERGDCL